MQRPWPTLSWLPAGDSATRRQRERWGRPSRCSTHPRVCARQSRRCTASTTPPTGCRPGLRSRHRSATGSRPWLPPSCSPSDTDERRWTPGNCPGSSPGSRGRRRPRSPGSTSLSLPSSPSPCCGRSPRVRSLPRSRPPTTRRSRTPSAGSNARSRSPAPGPAGCARCRCADWSLPPSPTATPAPEIPTCTPTSQSRTRCRPSPAKEVGGSPWTVGSSTRPRWPPPSVTTPGWKASSRPGSGSPSPSGRACPPGRCARSSASTPRWRGPGLRVDTTSRYSVPTSLPTSSPTMSWIQGAAATVVAALEEHRATWQVWHVRAEAERQARAAAVPLRELDSAVDRVVEHTLTRCSIPLGVPDPVAEPVALRRPDGSSVYDVHGARFHTSTRILDAEHRLLRAAHLTAGRRASLLLVGVALAESAANGLTLDNGQAALVRDLATSGHKLQLAIAPAGTGKTTALVVLARAWRDCDGDVIGLAPSAAAARQLGEATGMRTDTLAKLTDCLHNQPGDRWPFWIRAIGPRTLAILDEAGQAGTRDLADAVDFIIGRGGSVRLIGDDQQLAAVGAGGFLRDLRSTVGATTLTDIHRFTDPAEAAATLAPVSYTHLRAHET